MGAGAIIGGGLKIIGGINDRKEQKRQDQITEEERKLGRAEAEKAGEEAIRMAGEAADLEAKNTAEKLRLTGKEQAYQQSLAKAKAAASGTGGGGTTELYLDALKTAGQEELDWISLVGEADYQKQIDIGELGFNEAMKGWWDQPVVGGGDGGFFDKVGGWFGGGSGGKIGGGIGDIIGGIFG